LAEVRKMTNGSGLRDLVAGYGYDATAEERRLTLTMALIGMAVAMSLGGLSDQSWQWWQWAVVLFLAFDLIGGAAASALPAATRKNHPAGQPLRPLLVAALHVHPFLLALALPSSSWVGATALWIAAVVGVAMVHAVELSLKRGFALAYCSIALAALHGLASPPGVGWFAAAYLLKIVAALAVPGVVQPPSRQRRR
jgi:hypothetical protein